MKNLKSSDVSPSPAESTESSSAKSSMQAKIKTRQEENKCPSTRTKISAHGTVLRDNLTSKQKNEGTLRVRYDVVEEGTSMDYTIIGRQKNGKLEEVEELDLIATVSGHLTPEEMLGHAESSNTTALITATVIALAFAIPGVIILLKAFKSGQPAAKGKKRA